MGAIESLPDRPLTPTELQAIEQAGDYDLVAPVEWDRAERELPVDERIHLVVIVAEDSVTVLNLCGDCGTWHIALEGERREGDDPRTSYHLAVAQMRRQSYSG